MMIPMQIHLIQRNYFHIPYEQLIAETSESQNNHKHVLCQQNLISFYILCKLLIISNVTEIVFQFLHFCFLLLNHQRKRSHIQGFRQFAQSMGLQNHNNQSSALCLIINKDKFFHLFCFATIFQLADKTATKMKKSNTKDTHQQRNNLGMHLYYSF